MPWERANKNDPLGMIFFKLFGSNNPNRINSVQLKEKMQMYKNDVEDLIKARVSTRTYDGSRISESDKKELLDFCQKLDNENYRFEIINLDRDENIKIGTYGFIRGAKSFLFAVAKEELGRNKEMAVDFGYDFEKIILKATDMGLDTCWLGMAYKENAIRKMIKMQPEERIAMASPLGKRKGQRVFEKVARSVTKADHRLEFSKIFFKESMNNGLELDTSNPYHKALEMVRLAPSAGNAQPWRVIETEEGYGFFAKGNKFYDKLKDKRVDLTSNDMGIAKLHFDLIVQKFELKGEFESLPVEAEKPLFRFRIK